jgi:hypothetical protein
VSVKRYDIDAYSWFGTAHWTLVESEVGDFVYASDYDELRERHNALVSAVARLRKLDREKLHPVTDGLLIDARAEVDRLL